VIDWEMFTVGAPAADLAYCCMGHHLPPVGFLKQLSLLGRNPEQGKERELPAGIPTEHEMIAVYQQELETLSSTGTATAGGGGKTTEVIDEDKWKYFLALGFFRAAAIAAGTMLLLLRIDAAIGS
jgi:hypothetical protein